MAIVQNEILTYRNKDNHCGNKIFKRLSILLHKVKYLYNLQEFLFLKPLKYTYTLQNVKNKKINKGEHSRKEIEHPYPDEYLKESMKINS